MKVTCEYCGSYVEADENMVCPQCLAELGSAVKTEQERVTQQEQEEQERKAEEAAQEAKENRVSQIIAGVATVATTLAAGSAASNAGEYPHPPADGHGHHSPMGEPPDGTHRGHGHGGPREFDNYGLGGHSSGHPGSHDLGGQRGPGNIEQRGRSFR